MKLLIASNNPAKRQELQALLCDLPVDLCTPADLPGAPDVVEDGRTFEENAAKKARELACFSGLYTVADDSGLCVDALGGRPGLHSARYAGPEPTTETLCAKLLGEMKPCHGEERTAHFQCCIAFAAPSGETIFVARGRCEGIIAEQMRGTNGFGYDPVFVYPPDGRTFAEMAPEEKNEVSHRGRALEQFRDRFRAWIESAGRERQT